jgi:hypothetical protein
MRFTIQARQKPYMTIQVQYQDTLASLGNPENSLIELGWKESGGVSFILSGNDSTNFVGSNPPTTWMQATLPTIGSKTLRDIAMPESHDAGISELTHKWSGIKHNTQTQLFHIYKQLLFGARGFDIRPAHYKGYFYTGHFSGNDHTWFGGTGRTIEHIVEDVNRFTAEHPGELIFLDLSHDQDIDNWWLYFSDILWQRFFRELSKINDLWVPSNDNLPEDLSTVPITTFITPGSKSAVVVIVPDGAPLPADTPALNKRSTMYDDIPKTLPPEPDDNPEPYNPDYPPIDPENGFGDYPGSEHFQWTSYWLHHNLTNAAFPQLDIPANMTLKSNHISHAHALNTTEPILFPLGPWSKAFIHAYRISQTGSYSDTRSEFKLIPDQLAKLSSLRPSPSAPIHHSVWIITQWWTDAIDVWAWKHSIIYMARYAQHNLLRDLWGKMVRGKTWPNLIEIDNVEDNLVAALCVGINDYFSTTTTSAANKRSVRRRLREVEEEVKALKGAIEVSENEAVVFEVAVGASPEVA